MSSTIFIHIPIEPSRTTHQSGTRISRGHTYKTAALQAWEATLEEELKKYVPNSPLEEAILLDVTWAFKARTKKQDGMWKVTRPDTDNLQKTLKDVMTKMEFWKDDAQVVCEMAEKVWATTPGISIRIESLDEKRE
ncbi:MAG: RusA family crossover junction endodeoxyribonuclease [Allobaculum sp.]|nr:RusA family crossover junction endodeoxyribonuclease [Allobaculum sp.]